MLLLMTAVDLVVWDPALTKTPRIRSMPRIVSMFPLPQVVYWLVLVVVVPV